MAIGADSAVEFFGTQDAIMGGGTIAAVADAAFSIIGATGVLEWVNDDDAPVASITLEANFSVAPDANSSINLYAAHQNVVSTNDADVPDANNQHMYLGSFPLNDVTTAQYITIMIALPNAYTSQAYNFHIENSSGQSVPASSWSLNITPKTIGPHA